VPFDERALSLQVARANCADIGRILFTEVGCFALHLHGARQRPPTDVTGRAFRPVGAAALKWNPRTRDAPINIGPAATGQNEPNGLSVFTPEFINARVEASLVHGENRVGKTRSSLPHLSSFRVKHTAAEHRLSAAR